MTTLATTKNRSSKNIRRQTKNTRLMMEALEQRDLPAAHFLWNGDALQVNGTNENDFIAVQEDSLGVKVFANDMAYTSHEGKSFNDATSIAVSGQDGNDILFNYETSVPVELLGDAGNDFLFSDNVSGHLDGGEGNDWVFGAEVQQLWENAMGIEGLNLNPSHLNGIPHIDENNLINLQVELGGEVDVAGKDVEISGIVDVGPQGIDVSVTGSVANWDDAFGIVGFDLTNTSLTLSAGHHFNEGNGYSIALDSQTDIRGTDVAIASTVAVMGDDVSASFTGSVADWDDAFGIDDFRLKNVELTGSGSVDADDNYDLSFGLNADMTVEATDIAVAATVDLTPDSVYTTFSGSVENWDDAFGIDGLTLQNAALNGSAYTNSANEYDLHFDVVADMDIEGTDVDVSGSVNIKPDSIDGTFHGSVDNWNDAFGIDGLTLKDSELNVMAYTNRSDDYALHIDVLADMYMDDQAVVVSGSVDMNPEVISGTLYGSVASNWTDAFGISGLTLHNTNMTVNMANDINTGTTFGIDINADMDVAGTAVKVNGTLDIAPDSVDATFTGTVGTAWTDAFGITGLHVNDTQIFASAHKDADGSEFSLGIDAGVNLLGIDVDVAGLVNFTPTGLHTNLTGSLVGELTDAFGIGGLNLKDTNLSITNATGESTGLNIDLYTDLDLFGSYIDVVGQLDLSPAGVNVSFAPPLTLDFVDFLGIDGFDLTDTSLAITAGTDVNGGSGVKVELATELDLGNIDVQFKGTLTVSPTGIQASLTGTVATWNNAFDVAGLNMEDIVMTLGVSADESGAGFFIGLGASISIGSKELDVAGLVGLSQTGWEVAFRGEINSLTSNDLVDFANTMTLADNPNATPIPTNALGNFDLREAYINFAPKGGNEDLGITDGFGIGGDFYQDGDLLAGGEFEIDLEQLSFEVGLNIPELALGPVQLEDVLVDIRIAPVDSHFHVSGNAELMGTTVHVSGTLEANGSFSLSGNAYIPFSGLATTVEFSIDNSGIRFEATATGAAIDSIKESVTKDLKAVANDAQALINQANQVVAKAQADVNELESDLAAARAQAQREIDQVKADIAAAKSVVASAKSTKTYWYNVRKSRYNAWRSAVSRTNRASWWDYAYYKSIEASKYASYVAAAGTYSGTVAAYNAAVAALNVVEAAAGWALDTAGVEANPEVLRIKALLATSNLGLDAARTALSAVQAANSAALQLLDVVDNLQINSITFAGNVEAFASADFSAEIDYSWMGSNQTLTMQASTGNLAENLVGVLTSTL